MSQGSLIAINDRLAVATGRLSIGLGCLVGIFYPWIRHTVYLESGGLVELVQLVLLLLAAAPACLVVVKLANLLQPENTRNRAWKDVSEAEFYQAPLQNWLAVFLQVFLGAGMLFGVGIVFGLIALITIRALQ